MLKNMQVSVDQRDASAAPAPAESPERLARLAEAGSVTPEHAYRLIQAQGTALVTLLMAASLVRDRHTGHLVTYSRKVFIPLTNLCRDKCGYCTFAKAPGHADARTLTPDDVLAIARAGRDQGCKEALFSLGEKPEDLHALAREHLRHLGYPTMTAYLAAMCELVFEETGLLPHAHCGVLSREELLQLREVNASVGLMLESASPRLMEPGQAHFGCVGKEPSLRLETIATAGELGMACTSGILIGIGETTEERVDALFALRELQQRSANLQEVIVQNFRVKPDIRMRAWGEPSALDMLRTIAVARLVLGGDQNIQAPPNLTPDAYQMYLLAGINDWGGISPVTKDHINPERAWPLLQELRQVTADAGFDLRERLCLYPEYVRQSTFVRERLRPRIEALVDASGLVREEETRW
jgi:7,8-didemethyl-8-hydroxy-5-deazariboflavin synthase CofG subunit